MLRKKPLHHRSLILLQIGQAGLEKLEKTEKYATSDLPELRLQRLKLSLFWNNEEEEVEELLRQGGYRHTKDKVTGLEEFAHGACLDRVHGARLQIDQDGTGHILAGHALAGCRVKETGSVDTRKEGCW